MEPLMREGTWEIGPHGAGQGQPRLDTGALLRLGLRALDASAAWLRIGEEVWVVWAGSEGAGEEVLRELSRAERAPGGEWMGALGGAGPVQAYAALPLGGEEEGSVGVVAFESRAWTPADRAALGELEAAVRAQLRLSAEARERGRSMHALQFLHKAVTNMQLGVTVTDLEGRIVYTNPAEAAMHGYRPDELVGRHASALAPADLRRPLNPAVYHRVQSWTRESTNVRRDGTRFPVLLWSDVVTDAEGARVGLVTCCQDLSERQAAEEALRRSEYRFRAIFDNAGIGIALIGADGWIMRVNPAFEQMLGIPGEDLRGRTVIEFSHPEDVPTVRALYEQLSANPDRHFQTGHRLALPDRETVWVQQTVSSVADAQGRPLFLVSLLEDVTERHNLQEQLRHSQKMEAVGRLAGGIAHDFGNLLTAIKGNADLLLADCAADHPMRRDIAEIQHAAVRATALTRQLLAFSRRQSTKPALIDLNARIVELRDVLHRLLGADVVFETDLTMKVGPVRMDASHVEQLVINLAVNARDAMPQGGRLTVETANVEVSETESLRAPRSLRSGRYVRLAVHDTGIGMDEQTLARIYEPFYTSKPETGTGLGLSIVYGIVQESGGHIEVTSVVGKGSSFRIYLPRVEGDETSEPGEGEPDDVVRVHGSETLLFVEGEGVVRTLARRTLLQHGYTVLDAESGAEALQVASEYEGPIDLLITDLTMPGISGRELADRVRSERPEMGVLYTSGYASDAAIQRGGSAASAAMLFKPYAPRLLLGEVRRVLDTRHRGRRE